MFKGARPGESARQPAPEGSSRQGPAAAQRPAPLAPKQRGDAAEERALQHLQSRGLKLVQRNYRLAGGPRQRGAEIDLILQAPDGTLVFVEVRQRRDARHGGAAASIGGLKQQRIVRAAQHFLLRFDRLPPCRFDVVAIDGDALVWLPGAFGT